jgi:two-component system sensor histidine kinase DctS
MINPPAPPLAVRPLRRRRVVLWVALVGLIAVAQSLLVWLTLEYESSRVQEQTELAAASVAADVKQAFSRHQQSVQALVWHDPPPPQWRAESVALLQARRELMRVERRDPRMQVADAVDSPFEAPLFTPVSYTHLRAHETM